MFLRGWKSSLFKMAQICCIAEIQRHKEPQASQVLEFFVNML